MLGVSGGRVSQLVRQGRLRAKRGAGRVFVFSKDVARYQEYRAQRRRIAALVRAAQSNTLRGGGNG